MLPRDVLRARLKNELRLCEKLLPHKVVAADAEFRDFPAKLFVKLNNVPGPVLGSDGTVGCGFQHEFSIEITENYPWQKPVVRWLTPLFHPNIAAPEEGGRVCTKMLDVWVFADTLVSFIKAIETLLLNPNPRNPLGADTCTKAAQYFNKHPWRPPLLVEPQRQKPRIILSGAEKGTREDAKKWLGSGARNKRPAGL